MRGQLRTAIVVRVLIDVSAVMESIGRTAGEVAILTQQASGLVARVDSDGGPVVVKAHQDRAAFNGEVASSRRLAAAGLPVPTILGHAEGPPAYLVMSWIPGTPLSSTSPIAAQRQAGQLLRQIHQLGAETPHPGDQPFDRWMAGWLNHITAWWVQAGRGDTKRVQAAWTWYEQLRPLLATRGADLVLFDGRPDHWIVRNDRIAGLIDVHDVCSGDAAMDLAVMAVSDPDLLPGILDGYRPTSAQAQAFDQLIPFYTFLRRLAAAEWNLTYGEPTLAEQCLDLVDRNPPPTPAASTAR
jgi:aminoglycoside phosphotransferase